MDRKIFYDTFNRVCSDDFVISGMSCRLPESDSVDEFAEHLYNHDDMVTDDARRCCVSLRCAVVENTFTSILHARRKPVDTGLSTTCSG